MFMCKLHKHKLLNEKYKVQLCKYWYITWNVIFRHRHIQNKPVLQYCVEGYSSFTENPTGTKRFFK